MCAQQRIALYGGTFDPVHVGHVEIARRVSALFEIQKLIFIPAQMAPHKIGRPVTDPIHRYAMLAFATQDDPGLSISTFELDDPSRRYTVDTIGHFRRELNSETELFFIMGADSWSEITTWREWERLLTTTNHIVVTRPGHEPSTTHIGPLRELIVDLRAGRKVVGPNAKGIFFTDVVMNDVSATNARRLASEGRYQELEQLLPQPVLEYIRKYKIYEDTNEAKLNN